MLVLASNCVLENPLSLLHDACASVFLETGGVLRCFFHHLILFTANSEHLKLVWHYSINTNNTHRTTWYPVGRHCLDLLVIYLVPTWLIRSFVCLISLCFGSLLPGNHKHMGLLSLCCWESWEQVRKKESMSMTDDNPLTYKYLWINFCRETE